MPHLANFEGNMIQPARTSLFAVTALAMLALTGCGGGTTAEPAAPVEETTAADEPSGAESIEDAIELTGCEERPLLGETEAPVVASAGCKIDGGDLAYLFELPSPDAAMDWLDSGGLEIGSADAVYVTGSVVLLAADAGTAQAFAKVAAPYEG